MPVSLGQFYAFLLLATCLSINIAFFSDVREPFLGSDDAVVSAKLALSELNVQARIAEFYPQVQSRVKGFQNALPSVVPRKQEDFEQTSELPADVPKSEAVTSEAITSEAVMSDPILDPFLLPSRPPKETFKIESKEELVWEEETISNESALPESTISAITPERRELAQQTVAIIPSPMSAVTNPVVANQFKPITITPVESPAARETQRISNTRTERPSSNAIWQTVDTVLERPIRYDL
jgi:hypothetical protein